MVIRVAITWLWGDQVRMKAHRCHEAAVCWSELGVACVRVGQVCGVQD